MSQDKLNNALASLLTAQSSVELHKILTDIRKDVEWPRNKDNITRIREKKSLKYIVASLNSQQRNVLNVSLSILGNCLMDRDCSRDAVSILFPQSGVGPDVNISTLRPRTSGNLNVVSGGPLQHSYAHQPVAETVPKG